MVATRRMVQKGPQEEMASEQDLNQAAKKKPIRKATAKTTTKTTETKAKTTRGRKADPEAVPDSAHEDVPTQRENPQEAKTSRRTVGRAKKEISEEAPEVVTKETNKQARTTKTKQTGSVRGTGSMRGKKAIVAVEAAPPDPAPEPTKLARQTRGVASKPQALSPKKITQVARPQTRTTKAAVSKQPAKAASEAPATRGRGAMRKRTVSDENADVPDLAPPADGEAKEDGDEDDVISVSKAPALSRPKSTRTAKRDDRIESEASMSSRSTTPSHSPARSLSTVDERDGADHADINSDAAESVQADESEASEDELCGPKTPMKRSSPGAQARYLASAQKTIRKYNEEARTPARSSALDDAPGRTPQTLKPHSRPAAPSSRRQPVASERGTQIEGVVKDIYGDAPDFSMNSVHEASEIDESFIPDDDILGEVLPGRQDGNFGPIGATQLEFQPSSGELPDNPNNAVQAFAQDDFEMDQESNPVNDKLEEDPDETILIHERDEDISAIPAVQPTSSFESDDTVLVTHFEEGDVNNSTLIDDDDDDDDVSIGMYEQIASPTPETMVWENIRLDQTITVNFDDHLARARTLPQLEETEVLERLDVTESALQNEEAVIVRDETEKHEVAAPIQSPLRWETRTSTGDTTVNLNDFIDFTALSEPTQPANVSLDDPVEPQPEEKPANDDTTVLGVHVEDFGVELTKDHAQDQPAVLDGGLQTDNVDVPSAVQQDDAVLSSAAEQADPQREHDTNDIDEVPHYARSTFAFDARRKSLPNLGTHTPVKFGNRPSTSDGASLPRMANPFTQLWCPRSRRGSTATSAHTTPSKSRPNTAHGALGPPTPSTPTRSAVPSVAATPVMTPRERHPRLAPRDTYEAHAQTIAAPTRFHTPAAKQAKRRITVHRAVAAEDQTKPSTTPIRESRIVSPVTTTTATERPTMASPTRSPLATPKERYPRLRPRQDYEEHARTVAGPVRFQTPTKTPVKRPATAQKPESLRKAAIKANVPRDSHTPVKTPLKAPAMTPSQVPMTPHPAAPLRSVVALVEVFTLEGASASAPFIALLHRLGAKTTRAWNDRVTHVVFKDGSPTTLQRVRLHNKDVDEKGAGVRIHCVNSRWVTDCDTEGARMEESDDAFAVDVAEIPRGGKRRRKSMEPSALLNLNGNIVQDRKSSLGRSSLGRSPLKFDSPTKKPDVNMRTPERVDVATTPTVGLLDKENSGDEQGSPATPAWIAAPDQLVQQTAPMNRMRKLQLKGPQEAKKRRLTFWNGVA